MEIYYPMLIQGISYFSTDGGKRPPRAAGSQPPPTIVRSDPKGDAELFIRDLRSRFPHVCNAIFPGWDIRWYFDEHDFQKHGGHFLYEEVLMAMMHQNMNNLMYFCHNWSDLNRQHYLCLANGLYGVYELFAVRDQEKWGLPFLGIALQHMRLAFGRAAQQSIRCFQAQAQNGDSPGNKAAKGKRHQGHRSGSSETTPLKALRHELVTAEQAKSRLWEGRQVPSHPEAGFAPPAGSAPVAYPPGCFPTAPKLMPVHEWAQENGLSIIPYSGGHVPFPGMPSILPTASGQRVPHALDTKHGLAYNEPSSDFHGQDSPIGYTPSSSRHRSSEMTRDSASLDQEYQNSPRQFKNSSIRGRGSKASSSRRFSTSCGTASEDPRWVHDSNSYRSQKRWSALDRSRTEERQPSIGSGRPTPATEDAEPRESQRSPPEVELRCDNSPKTPATVVPNKPLDDHEAGSDFFGSARSDIDTLLVKSSRGFSPEGVYAMLSSIAPVTVMKSWETDTNSLFLVNFENNEKMRQVLSLRQVFNRETSTVLHIEVPPRHWTYDDTPKGPKVNECTPRLSQKSILTDSNSSAGHSNAPETPSNSKPHRDSTSFHFKDATTPQESPPVLYSPQDARSSLNQVSMSAMIARDTNPRTESRADTQAEAYQNRDLPRTLYAPTKDAITSNPPKETESVHAEEQRNNEMKQESADGRETSNATISPKLADEGLTVELAGSTVAQEPSLPLELAPVGKSAKATTEDAANEVTAQRARPRGVPKTLVPIVPKIKLPSPKSGPGFRPAGNEISSDTAKIERTCPVPLESLPGKTPGSQKICVDEATTLDENTQTVQDTPKSHNEEVVTKSRRGAGDVHLNDQGIDSHCAMVNAEQGGRVHEPFQDVVDTCAESTAARDNRPSNKFETQAGYARDKESKPANAACPIPSQGNSSASIRSDIKTSEPMVISEAASLSPLASDGVHEPAKPNQPSLAARNPKAISIPISDSCQVIGEESALDKPTSSEKELGPSRPASASGRNGNCSSSAVSPKSWQREYRQLLGVVEQGPEDVRKRWSDEVESVKESLVRDEEAIKEGDSRHCSNKSTMKKKWNKKRRALMDDHDKHREELAFLMGKYNNIIERANMPTLKLRLRGQEDDAGSGPLINVYRHRTRPQQDFTEQNENYGRRTWPSIDSVLDAAVEANRSAQHRNMGPRRVLPGEKSQQDGRQANALHTTPPEIYIHYATSADDEEGDNRGLGISSVPFGPNDLGDGSGPGPAMRDENTHIKDRNNLVDMARMFVMPLRRDEDDATDAHGAREGLRAEDTDTSTVPRSDKASELERIQRKYDETIADAEPFPEREPEERAGGECGDRETNPGSHANPQERAEEVKSLFPLSASNAPEEDDGIHEPDRLEQEQEKEDADSARGDKENAAEGEIEKEGTAITEDETDRYAKGTAASRSSPRTGSGCMSWAKVAAAGPSGAKQDGRSPVLEVRTLNGVKGTTSTVRQGQTGPRPVSGSRRMSATSAPHKKEHGRDKQHRSLSNADGGGEEAANGDAWSVGPEGAWTTKGNTPGPSSC